LPGGFFAFLGPGIIAIRAREKGRYFARKATLATYFSTVEASRIFKMIDCWTSHP
jgi:hypothetical protein